MNAPAKGFIPKPGHCPDLPNAVYHTCPGISKSGVMLLLQSPLHYWHAYHSGQPKREPTPAMVMGSLVHTLVLEPEKFEAEYIVAPDISRRSNAGKEAWLAFEREAGSRQIISQEQLDEARKVVSAVRGHPFAGPALSGGKAEQSYFWHDPLTGDVLCKCRPDYVRKMVSGVVLLDLKTTDDASPEAFSRACANFGYHVSAAMSMDGYEHATGTRPLAYKFVVVEKSAPYAVAVYELEERAIQKGRDIYQDALCLYRDCVASEDWPGFPAKTQTIDLPKWAYTQGSQQ